MCLLLGPTGAGKSLLAKRLHKLSLRDGMEDLGDLPPTRPTVGTNLTDIGAQRQVTIRELGGCMAPIWPSYFGDCRALLRSALLHEHSGDEVPPQAAGHPGLCSTEHQRGGGQRSPRDLSLPPCQSRSSSQLDAGVDPGGAHCRAVSNSVHQLHVLQPKQHTHSDRVSLSQEEHLSQTWGDSFICSRRRSSGVDI
ncbi:ADP-ribosylation factor-like protein 16 isoform X1 [Suncus etruscus]|uniref:ADP-ribosylation factor-like protein 16 isoform X1 n=1 Tax=Suncus etruscus TaxID=109475 RepID=UPI00210FF457|nr:ADP-ribosylation factor-like protein 16 isoform X1 [Suncus etruscus]